MRIVCEGEDDMVSAALELAASGMPVFPCRPDAKSPLTVRGFHEATTDHQQIRSWWARYPNANIGAPTGALSDCLVTFDVLDVDVKGGTSGYRSLERLEEDGLLRGLLREWEHPQADCTFTSPDRISRRATVQTWAWTSRAPVPTS
ncbi:MAG: bifunctional DNA primase/polymerase [Nocardioidaceae bacterium]|nr:bifunctional DNA primase/polymerase [Nocardioidaceae bacterium]